MTPSMRAFRPIALLATALTAGVYLARSPTTGEQQRIAIERRDRLPRAPAPVVRLSQDVTAPLPVADARTLLKYGYLLEAIATTDADATELLFAKLRHKQQYALMLAQGGIDRAGLSAQEREYAHSLLTGALRDYRDAYLEEMRAHLNPEQFRMLSDFERTEFDLELQRMEQSINER